MKLSHVLVTDKSVYFDGLFEAPCYIAENGVKFEPGLGRDCNRLTVEFLTGPVLFDGSHDGTAPHFDGYSPTPIYDRLVSEIGCPV